MTAIGGLPWIRFPGSAFIPRTRAAAIELTNFRSTALISPAIAWLLSGSANMDKGTFQIQNPKLTQIDRFRPRSGDDRDQCGRRRLGVDAGEGGDCRPRPQSGRSRRKGRPAGQFQRPGGKGADQSWRRRLQEPQGVRPLGPACGPSGARRSRRRTKRSSRACSRTWRRPASSSTRGSKRRRPSSPRRSAQSLWRISNISSARRMRGRRARSTSAFPPTD